MAGLGCSGPHGQNRVDKQLGRLLKSANMYSRVQTTFTYLIRAQRTRLWLSNGCHGSTDRDIEKVGRLFGELELAECGVEEMEVAGEVQALYLGPTCAGRPPRCKQAVTAAPCSFVLCSIGDAASQEWATNSWKVGGGCLGHCHSHQAGLVEIGRLGVEVSASEHRQWKELIATPGSRAWSLRQRSAGGQ